jgi:hypothetical protein
MVINKIIPALGLAKMSDSDLDTYVGERVASLIASEVDFPDLIPTVDTVTAQRVKFRSALDNIVRGNKSSTTKKNKERAKLEALISQQAENCAEISDGDLEIYQKSGYGSKSKGHSTEELPAPINLTVELGPGLGQLYVRFKGVENAHSYEIWYGLATANPDSWTEHITASSGRKSLLNELGSNVEYGVRVRAIGGNNLKGDWTTVIIKKTY